MRNLIYFILGLMMATTASAGNFSLKSSAFHDNERIPVLYTCNGDNISPPLSWDKAPAKTKSFALIMVAPGWINEDIYLWILYNLPAEVKGLEQGTQSFPKGTVVSTNYYDETNYRGPCPPDARLHRYVFTLYALDSLLPPLADDIEPKKLMAIIKPHIIEQAKLTGLFSH